MENVDDYINRINLIRSRIHMRLDVDVSHILDWLNEKREKTAADARLVPLHALDQWEINLDAGIIRHKKGRDHFFTIEGVAVNNADRREVVTWNQPIINQAEGGILVILCQERDNEIKFLLDAKFEPGNIGKLQLAPTIQATQSNLKQHHSGKKPRFSEYWNNKNTILIYNAEHNEEGGRFWRKSNVNALVLLNKDEKLIINSDDSLIWLSLAEIKKLMLYNNVVNPFVKTILGPL